MRHRRPGSLQNATALILESIGEAPEDQTRPPVLVLLVGLPGSGKSTFARRLSGLIEAAVLESDALRRLLFRYPSYSAGESRRLFEALRAAARTLLAAGRSVIVDATNLKDRDRQPFYALAAAPGARLLVLRFSAPLEVIEQRMALRGDGVDVHDNSEAGIAVYQMMAEREEPLLIDHLQIDTTDPVAAERALQWVVEACRPSTAAAGMGG